MPVNPLTITTEEELEQFHDGIDLLFQGMVRAVPFLDADQELAMAEWLQKVIDGVYNTTITRLGLEGAGWSTYTINMPDDIRRSHAQARGETDAT